MKQDETKKLFSYWSELYARHGIPERSQIEPSSIRKVLGDTFILEYDSGGEVRYRLAGTRLCAAYGVELKGELFHRPWQNEEKNTIRNVLASAGDNQLVVLFGSTAASRDGRTISLETLILPLLHNQAPSQRLLGITTPVSRPYWLGADPIVRQVMTSLRIIDPPEDNVPFRSQFRLLRGNSSPSVVRLPEGKRVRHLTVVDGGLMDSGENPTI